VEEVNDPERQGLVLTETVHLERRSATANRWAFEHAAAGIGVVDLKGRFIDVNRALCSLYGRNEIDLLGHHPDEYISAHHGPSAADQIVAALSDRDTPLGGEAILKRPDGSAIWILASVSTIEDSKGLPEYFFVQVQDITPQKSAEERLCAAHRQLRRTFDDVVLAIARSVELRDPYTAGHQVRVAALAVAIAEEMSMDADTVEGIRVAATIHDIGKLAIPSEILTRPGRLSRPELDLIKTHAKAGHEIVAGIDFPWPVARMVLEHHERLDGSGYPNGLRTNAICLGSRVISVADVLEAMAADRPYRPALGVDRAMDAITDGSGSLFDPAVVAAASAVVPRILGSDSGRLP
jgi:PAS domain S-box-containing protein/putative nucleotidyltransferase with HDIG domain